MELEVRTIADMTMTADGQEGIKAFPAKKKAYFSGMLVSHSGRLLTQKEQQSALNALLAVS